MCDADETVGRKIRPHRYIHASGLENGQECKGKHAGSLDENPDRLLPCYAMSDERVGENVGPNVNLAVCHKRRIGNDGRGFGLPIGYGFKAIMKSPRRPTSARAVIVHTNNILGQRTL